MFREREREREISKTSFINWWPGGFGKLLRKESVLLLFFPLQVRERKRKRKGDKLTSVHSLKYVT